MFIQFYTAIELRKEVIFGEHAVRTGALWSFTVIENGTNRKHVCYFILVFNCNYMALL